MNKKMDQIKEKKLELYKVPGYDFLFLDSNGEPYTLHKRKLTLRKRHNGHEEYYLQSHEHGIQKIEVHKNIVAKTFLGKDDKYVYFKDNNTKNYHPDNLELSSNFNKEYYCTCRICGKLYKKNNPDSRKTGLCSRCRQKAELVNRKSNKLEKRKELFEYFMQNTEHFRMTSARFNILMGLKKGLTDSEIAENLNRSRQAIHANIKSILESILKNKERLQELHDDE